MKFRVSVIKRLLLAVEADTEAEAHALAVVTATGAATPADRAVVTYLAKSVTVESLDAEPARVVP